MVAFMTAFFAAFAAVSAFDPVPGSEFHKRRQEFGIIEIDEDYAKHAHLVYRYGDREEVGLPFRFADKAEWGPVSTNIKE